MSTIVVVEDNVEILDNLVDLLEAEGHDVHPAVDGTQGLAAVREHRPDLVLCDVMMPGIDGYEVLRRVREDEGLADVPFLFLTARTERTARRAGMDLGADDYLTKPFTHDELLRALDSRLERANVHHRRTEALLAELRDDLARSIPHELRTPLVSILGYGELLRDYWRDMDPAEVDEMLTGIDQSARRLRRAAENIGLHAELSAEDAAADDAELLAAAALLADGPAAASLEGAWNAVRELADEHGRSDDLELALAPLSVAMPEFHLQKVLGELVDNACKFSPPGTPVQVRARAEGELCRLSVRDHGRGMEAGDLERIGPYRQFGRSEHEQQGLGLGLALVRALAESAGGRFEVESRPGEGTTVLVDLPLEITCPV